MASQEIRIGPYRVERPLGRGGMGVVFRAAHVETGALVAVKTVDAPRPGTLASLRREVHALARLRHPGIVRIVDEGVHEGLPWYAMELVEGVDLREYAAAAAFHTGDPPGDGRATRPLGEAGWWTRELSARATSATTAVLAPAGAPRDEEVRAVLSLGRRLCEPLGHLHGEGMVHRDLKPENVLVRPDGTLVLVDFGLLSRFSSEEGRAPLELGGEVVGTVAYMAPEQVQGQVVDARADLYALGCVLYELLVGHPPFVGESPVQVLWKHVDEAPIPPSRLVPELPPGSDDLLLRLLAKDPRDRLGYADDVAAALVRLGASGGPPMRRRSYLYRTTFTGREDVVDGLAGKLGVVLVSGESGVGKTRLAMEVAERAARRGARVLLAECHPGDALPLQAWRRPLAAIADCCRELGAAETERILGPRGPLLAPYAPVLSTLPGQECHPEPAPLPPDAARARLFQTLVETLACLASRQRLLVVLDDLQWADELTLASLAAIVEIGTDRFPVGILGTYRSEEIGDDLRRLERARGTTCVPLERLDAGAVTTLASDMLAMSPAPVPLTGFLARHSEGNPFFVAEYLRTMLDEGILERGVDGRWCLRDRGPEATAAAYEALPLPRSLRLLVAQRLSRLPPAARSLAAVASVLGREVEATILAAVAARPEPELLEQLDLLVTRRVLEDAGAGCYRFVHDKLREVAYDAIDAAERRDLHRAAALALEAAPSPDHAAALARHWREAEEPRRAAPYFLAAARAAVRAYAPASAEPLYHAYLGIMEPPTSESIGARVELGHSVLEVLGRTTDACEEHRRALREARALGERDLEARSLRAVAWVEQRLGHRAEARHSFEEALAIRVARGERRAQGALLADLGAACQMEGRVVEARARYAESIAVLQELGDRRLEAVVRANLAGLNYEQGALEEAREQWEAALSMVRAQGDRHREGDLLCNLGIVHAELGRFDRARFLHQEAIVIYRAVGNVGAEGAALGNLAAAACAEGQLEEALDLARRALSIHRDVRDPRFEGLALVQMIQIERWMGRLEEAVALAAQASALPTDGLGKRTLAMLCCERAHLEIAAGRACGELLAQARALAEELGAAPESSLGLRVALLDRAVAAFGAGGPLLNGEAADALPRELSRWLERS